MKRLLILPLIAVMFLSFSVVGEAQKPTQPFGHAAKHGLGTVDVVVHLCSDGVGMCRPDGSKLWLSDLNPNGMTGGMVSVHRDGQTVTAFELRNTHKAAKWVGNRVAKEGYKYTDIPITQRAGWAARGVATDAASKANGIGPPAIVIPDWNAICDLSRETLSQCQARWQATRKG